MPRMLGAESDGVPSLCHGVHAKYIPCHVKMPVKDDGRNRAVAKYHDIPIGGEQGRLKGARNRICGGAITGKAKAIWGVGWDSSANDHRGGILIGGWVE